MDAPKKPDDGNNNRTEILKMLDEVIGPPETRKDDRIEPPWTPTKRVPTNTMKIPVNRPKTADKKSFMEKIRDFIRALIDKIK